MGELSQKSVGYLSSGSHFSVNRENADCPFVWVSGGGDSLDDVIKFSWMLLRVINFILKHRNAKAEMEIEYFAH